MGLIFNDSIDGEYWIGDKMLGVYGSYLIFKTRKEAQYRADRVKGNLSEVEEYLTKEHKKKITIIVD